MIRQCECNGPGLESMSTPDLIWLRKIMIKHGDKYQVKKITQILKSREGGTL